MNKIEVITKVKKKLIHRKAINVRAIYMPVIVAKLIWNVVNMRRCKKAKRFAQNANRMEWKNEYAIMGIDTADIMWCARCRRNMVCSYASLRSNWATLNIIYVRVWWMNRENTAKKSIMNQIITIKLYSNALHLFIFQFGTPMIHSVAIRIIDSTVFTEILMISWSASYKPM